MANVIERAGSFKRGLPAIDSYGKFKLYPSEPYLTLEDFQLAEKLLIDRRYFYGTQRLDEYCPYKERAVKSALERFGIQFLLENPIFVCALPEINALSLAIIDGHSRVRFSGKRVSGNKIILGVGQIPSFVFDLEQTKSILNRAYESYGGQYYSSVGELEARIRSGMRDSTESFSHVMPDYKQPHVVSGITTFEELKTKFIPFSYRLDNIVVSQTSFTQTFNTPLSA